MTTQGTADNRQWEKTARLLVLNNLPSLLVMKDTIVKIVNNIVGNIHDEKFRVLKMTNSALQQKILNCHGGQEMLLCLGFTVCTQAETGAKNLELHLVDSSDDEECDMIVELLRSGLRWLQDTCATCELYATAGNSINGKNSKIGGIRAPASTSSARAPSSTAGGVGLAEGSCCEVIAQIKLPTGRVVSGGFMYSDLIGDVRRYASCYFAPDRYDDISIEAPLLLTVYTVCRWSVEYVGDYTHTTTCNVPLFDCTFSSFFNSCVYIYIQSWGYVYLFWSRSEADK